MKPLVAIKIFFIGILVFFTDYPAQGSGEDVMSKGWYTGSVEEAFAEAKKSNKPILLYWGAKWCPPCNELRSQVFSKSEFLELLPSVVAYYLDGDTDAAQIWGEKLNANGYPTLLLLSNNGEERVRFSTAVTMAEFREAFQAALLNSQSLADTRKELSKKKVTGTDSQWRFLAYVSSEELEEGEKLMGKLKNDIQLKDKFPVKLQKERAMFVSKLITSLSGLKGDDEKTKIFKSQQATWVEKELEVLLSNVVAIDGARSMISYSAKDVLGLVTGTKQLLELRKLWLAAADKIATGDNYSVDTRLWAVYPHLDLAKENIKELDQLPKDLIGKIKAAVSKADSDAKSQMERQAVISGAGYLLRESGLTDDARVLLIKEAKVSETPYYYYSSIANLEEKAGNIEKAKEWSAKARAGADGRATKLQWISSDILLKEKLKASDSELLPVLDEYYTLALQLADGFSGRNAARAKRVSGIIRERLLRSTELAKLLDEHEKTCKGIKNPNCLEHFAGIRLKAKT